MSKIITIKKRDGINENFDRQKIESAIQKAFIAVDKELTDYAVSKSKNIADFVEKQAKENVLTVEQIQDIVEHGLMSTKRKDVARAYISYRNERTLERERKSKLIKIIQDKIFAKNVLNQNANVDEFSFGGRTGEAIDSIMKMYALDYCMSKKARYNHLKNRIYTHDLGSYVVGMHNCFQRNTAFITDLGIKTFESFYDGAKIKVLDLNGFWRDATVRYYGRQSMQTVTFERCGKIKKVNCTANHRWILSDGSVTENLSVGDRLYCLNNSTNNYSINNYRDAEMFAFGFILGDGCDHFSEDGTRLYSKVRLCGEKIKYASIFESAHYKRNNLKESNTDISFCKRTDIGKQQFLTNHMWHLLSLQDKISLFNGYIAADGSTTTNTKKVWTSDERILQMIIDISALAGYHIFNINEINDSTKYKENRLLYDVTFTTNYSNNSSWKVINIKKQPNVDYEAWCVEEPITHSFTLADGVVTGNCLSLPIDDALEKGFITRQTDVRPAQSVNAAFQLLAVLFQLQSLQQFGGVSATHLDHSMVPYVRKSFAKHLKDGLEYIEEFPETEIAAFAEKYEGKFTFDNEEIKKKYPKVFKYAIKKTEKETYQAVEAMYHNLNTLQSRSGNQLPFSSINYGTCTLPEGRLVIRALLDNSIKGMGKLRKTSIFPCGIFQVMDGVNKKPQDPNYDLFILAIRSTSRRLYPNYANCDWSGNKGYDINDPRTYFSTMGCRTANGWDINGLGQLKDGRGNICPVTIIMPTLAMEALEEFQKNNPKNKNIEDIFLRILDEAIHDSRDQLIERYEWICNQDAKAASFMYDNNLMAGYNPEEGIRSALKHGTLAIGNLGLAETLQILMGCDHTEEKGMVMAKKIYGLFRDRCAEFKEEYKLNFGVYNTPAENLAYTAMMKFKEQYGIIKNVSENDFFTNSMHVPVWKQMTPFEKIDIESQLTGYSSAGCITYVELSSSVKNNIKALRNIVLYAMDKDIPYFAVNVPNDTCLDCGYCDEIDKSCPVCGGKSIQRLRRVTGYLTGDYKKAFNKGKQQETEMRVKHG